MNAKFNKMGRNEQDDIHLDNKFKKLKKDNQTSSSQLNLDDSNDITNYFDSNLLNKSIEIKNSETQSCCSILLKYNRSSL